MSGPTKAQVHVAVANSPRPRPRPRPTRARSTRREQARGVHPPQAPESLHERIDQTGAARAPAVSGDGVDLLAVCARGTGPVVGCGDERAATWFASSPRAISPVTCAKRPAAEQNSFMKRITPIYLVLGAGWGSSVLLFFDRMSEVREFAAWSVLAGRMYVPLPRLALLPELGRRSSPPSFLRPPSACLLVSACSDVIGARRPLVCARRPPPVGFDPAHDAGHEPDAARALWLDVRPGGPKSVRRWRPSKPRIVSLLPQPMTCGSR